MIRVVGGGRPPVNAALSPKFDRPEAVASLPGVTTDATPETPDPVYANVVEFTTGPYDIVLDFGFRGPEAAKRGEPGGYKIVSRVAMSLAHAKSMLPILARVIAEYEEQIGPITAPGFDELGKQ
jgi:hypothetical protein